MDRIIEVKVSGNHLSKDNKVAGVRGEANVTNLHIAFDEGWDTFSKRITFWDALGNNPTKILLDNKRECVAPIPGEAMAEAGKLTFVIDGYNGGKKQRSVADELEVKDAPMAENAAEPVDPTPDQATQLQNYIDNHKNDKNNPHGVTASQAGALPIEGGRLKGSLTIKPNSRVSSVSVELDPSDGGTTAKITKAGDTYGEYLDIYDSGSDDVKDRVGLKIRAGKTKDNLPSRFVLYDNFKGYHTEYEFYGEHNKPKASDVGAYSKEEADEFLDNLSEEMQNELANKVDKADGKGLSTNDFTDEYKAKLEGMDDAVDEKLEALSGKLDKYQTGTNTALGLKADKSNVYTKSETDSKLNTKANADNVYTKSETDSKLNAKANANSVYTKTEADSKLNDKADKNNVYSKDEMADILDTKADKADIVGVYKYKGSVDKFEDLPVIEISKPNDTPARDEGYLDYEFISEKQEVNISGTFDSEWSTHVENVRIPISDMELPAGYYIVEVVSEGLVGIHGNLFYGCSVSKGPGVQQYNVSATSPTMIYLPTDSIFKWFNLSMHGDYLVVDIDAKIKGVTFRKVNYSEELGMNPDNYPSVEIGSVYNVLDSGANYAYTGTEWVALGGGQKDLEVRKELETKADKSELVGVYKYKGSVDTKADMPQKYKILKINGNAKDSFGDNAAFYNGEDEEFDTLIVSYEKEYSPYVNCVITIPCEETTLMPGQYTFRSSFGDIEFGSGREFKFYIGDGINEMCFGSCNSQNFAYQTITVEEELKVTCINIRANATYGSYETIELYGPLLIDVKFEDHSFATKVGEVYNVRESGMNYAWDGEEWDGLGRDGVDEKTQELLSDIEWLREYRESSLQTAMRFDDYVQLINYFNSTDSATNSYGEPIAVSAWFGDYIHIRDESLPDLMVRKPYDMPKDCLFTTNDEFLAELKSKGFVRVGYVELSIAAITFPQIKGEIDKNFGFEGGKNILIPDAESGYWDATTLEAKASTNHIRTPNPIVLESGHSYLTITTDLTEGDTSHLVCMIFLDADGNKVGGATQNTNYIVNNNATATVGWNIPSNSVYFHLWISGVRTTGFTSFVNFSLQYDNRGIATFEPYVEPKTVLKKDSLAYGVQPLYGKTIVNFGDSIFGNYRPPNDISTEIAKLTGATVHNCGFGGCRMAYHTTSQFDSFCMYRLADAIANNDWTLQDNAVNATGWGMPAYYPNTLALLKSIDFSKVDIITIAYGTNDFMGGIGLDATENRKNTTCFGSALRYSLETLLNAYPHLKIFVCTQTYRFWMDDNGEFLEDSDTKTNSGGVKLTDFVAKTKEVADEYHIPYIDNYNIGMNKYNRGIYFSATDGTHPQLAGRHLIASHIANELF